MMQCWPGFAEGEKQMLTTSGDNVQHGMIWSLLHSYIPLHCKKVPFAKGLCKEERRERRSFYFETNY